MTHKGIFIDDDPDNELAALFSSDGVLEIEYCEVRAASELASEIFETKFDLAILDFRLDENPRLLNPRDTFLGSGLAQLLRDKAMANPLKDLPIVLMSAEEKFERFYRPDSTAHDLFDRTYGKEKAVLNRYAVSRQLEDLCAGYEALKCAWNSDRMQVFRIDEGEREILQNQELRTSLQTVGAPHIAANYILRSVIDRPGLLFADHDVAARLGIQSIDQVVPILVEAGLNYDGIFAQGWRRWWAHRVNEFAEKLFGKRPSIMGGQERASIVSKAMNIEVMSAVSTWNQRTDEKFAFACASCHRPTEIRHSVSAFDALAPRFSVRRRICWDCVQTDKNLENNIAVDDVDLKLAEEVKNKRREAD